MGLAARLSKLEEKAPRALRCAWCLYSLVNTPADQADETPESGSYILRRCPFCGTEYRADVREYTPRKVESFQLWDGKIDGETYRDERAYAAREWWTFSAHARGIRQIQEREARAASKPYVAPKAKPEVKETKEARDYRERRARAFALLRRAEERQERLYGPRIFPLVARLKEMEKEPKDFRLDEEKEFRSRDEQTTLWLRNYYERMAACEVVLWGEATLETVGEIGNLAAEAEGLAVKRRAEKLERERQREREEAERQERYRVEREERERARLERERERQQQYATPIPRANPRPVAPYDGPDAVTFQRSDPPDGYQRQLVAQSHPSPGLIYIPPEPESKPPPDDGTDFLYQFRLQRWKRTGVWATDDMLLRGGD